MAEMQLIICPRGAIGQSDNRQSDLHTDNEFYRWKKGNDDDDDDDDDDDHDDDFFIPRLLFFFFKWRLARAH